MFNREFGFIFMLNESNSVFLTVIGTYFVEIKIELMKKRNVKEHENKAFMLSMKSKSYFHSQSIGGLNESERLLSCFVRISVILQIHPDMLIERTILRVDRTSLTED